MPKAREVVAGEKFGRWAVVKEVDRRYRNRHFLCKCECGEERIVKLGHLVSGCSVSCGCYKNEESSERLRKIRTTHGMSNTRVYQIRHNMRNRCYNQNATRYKDRGGRGIGVCDRRRESFENFREDMKEGYRDNLTIDRIDNDGDYTPENCKRSTHSEQNKNQRNSK